MAVASSGNALSTGRELRVIITPHDFDKSRRFYSEILSWKISREWDNEKGKGVMYDTSVGTVELLSGYGPTSNVAGVRLSLRVDDVWSLWSLLKEKSEILFPLQENWWGDDSFCVIDPNGLEVQFFTDRPDFIPPAH